MAEPVSPAPMSPTAVYSKTGKGVQEATGKTSLLSRADRAVLTNIDGRTTFADLQIKFYKMDVAKLEALLLQLDKDGFVREVASSPTQGAPHAPTHIPAAKPAPAARPGPAAKPVPAAPPKDPDEELDFTAAPTARRPAGPAAPPPRTQPDLAAEARAKAEAWAKEEELRDSRARLELETKARAAAEAQARAESEARIRAEADAKVKAAQEAALRAAADARAKAEAEAKARADAVERERQAAAQREREALERARKESEEKVRVETELRAKLDAERKAREEAERAAKEEARREAEELRRQLEAERKAKVEAERKAREEAERRAKEEAERRAKEEAERKAREEAERRAKEEAERRAKEEAERRAKEEAERRAKEEAERKAREAAERERIEQARREAEELRQQLEAERKLRDVGERERIEAARREADERARGEADKLRQQLEAERKEKAEAERKAREEGERKAREEGERRAKEEAERKAREAGERERIEAARREADAQARGEADKLRQQLEAERKEKAEAERKAKEEADRIARTERERADQARREAEEKGRREADELRKQLDAERKAKEDAERRAKEESERRAKDDARREDADRQKREREERARKKIEAGMAATRAESTAPPAPSPAEKPPAGEGASIDALFADLNTFAQREEEERKAKEEADRKAKADAERQKEERRKREEEEQRKKADEERRRREQQEREREEAERAKAEAELKAKEEAERKEREAEERKRKAKEAYAAKQAEMASVVVKDEDLEDDDLKRDQAALAKSQERKQEHERERERKDAEVIGKAAASERTRNLGKKLALGAVALLLVAAGAIHVIPLSTGEYEHAAAQATGQTVKIGSARFSLVTGPQLTFQDVSVGRLAKIGTVRASPTIGSLFSPQKSFNRIELENAVIGEEQLGAVLLGTLLGSDFKVGTVAAKQIKLEGPIVIPPLDAEAVIAPDGTLQTLRITGPERLSGTVAARNGELTFEITAGSFPVPFLPGVTLADFGMKGNASRQGMGIAEFDGRALDGVFTGNSRIRWGDEWSVEGDLRVRGVNVGVFAPALMSEGKVEGSGKYAMKGPAPAKLGEAMRVEGNFKVDKGALGSFDLGRAMQGTGPLAGRTVFNELTGQGLYDKGAVQLRNVTITAGALNAGASVEIAPDGALSGRVIVDLKSARATLSLSGKVKEPVLKR